MSQTSNDPNNPAVMIVAHYGKVIDTPRAPAKMRKAHNSVQVVPTINITANDGTRLSEAGLKGLVVARQAALEMVARACAECGHVESWFRVPRDTQTIQEAMGVYGLVKILRSKCPSSPEPSLEAAIALRDVIIMMATDSYPSCEYAVHDIVVQCWGPTATNV